jgi:hypothetical protein
MKKKAIWYHAGCDVCVTAEHNLVAALDAQKVEVDRVDLGRAPARRDEAKRFGVKTLPALVIGSDVFHVNFGANLSDLG